MKFKKINLKEQIKKKGIDGTIITNNNPSYACINTYQKDLKIVKEAYKKDPNSVRFYANFCYVNSECYNQIRKEAVLQSE